MNEELALFYEDATDQLSFMEDALISMQEDGADEENIGALFRAMHTIKGTAGMFGFDDVVEFAHVAENLLSEVRDKRVILTEDMIETFLQARDQTQKLVDLAINGEDLDSDTQQISNQLLKEFKSMMPGGKGIDEIKIDADEIIHDNDDNSQILWHISVMLKETFLASGMDIINILSFFNMLGEVKNITSITAKVPMLDSLDPAKAYLGYEIEFLSSSSYQEIEEIFEFVVDDIELEIFKADDIDMTQALISLYQELDLQSTLSQNNFSCIKFIQEQKESKNNNELQLDESNTKTIESSKKVKKDIQKSFSLRVDSTKIDQLINQISEMVIANAKIIQRADEMDDNELIEVSTVMSDMLEDIRTGVMNIRMVQVGDSFNKFKRIVHDVAKKVHKEIEFEIVGGDTELDKMVVEKITDPLTHMLRNSIDHGIELPDDRVAAGKTPNGKVTLRTYPDAGTIVIEIEDDGKGLSKDKILSKAIANGIVDENAHLSDKEIYALIFSAGLSTADEVSDISGRGVGMDVVKQNIESLRGTVEIDSTPGKGSLFTIRLPLTLAIIDGFLVQSGETKYIMPLEMIVECIELDNNYKKRMKGNEFINLRDTMLPLLDVREYFEEEANQSIRDNVIVVRYGDYKMGLMVDELYGEFQTVIKPLGDVFSNLVGISGGTILGSGEIALIFDIPKLMEHKIKEIN